MGVYSIFFGSGMIIGPLAGEFMYQVGGLYGGLGVLVSILIAVACFGTYFLPETEVSPDADLETTDTSESEIRTYSEDEYSE